MKRADPKIIGRPAQDAQSLRERAVKHGWLYKRSDFTKQWNSRYCVLKRSYFLYYYEGEADKAPKGIIDLESYNSVETCPQEKKPFCFKLAGSSQLRPFLFEPRQEPAAEADEWMKALHQVRCSRMEAQAGKAPFSLNRSAEAMENMGTLGSSLNEERRTAFAVHEELAAMEKLLRAMPDDHAHERNASDREDGDVLSASKATRKDITNGEDVAKVAKRVHEMLQDQLFRTNQEKERIADALSKERERVDKATGGGWELLQKAQNARLEVEAQLSEERGLRHKESLAHVQVLHEKSEEILNLKAQLAKAKKKLANRIPAVKEAQRKAVASTKRHLKQEFVAVLQKFKQQMQEQKEAELGAQEEELLARFGAAMEMTDDIPGTPPLSVPPGSSSAESGSVDVDSLRESLSTALEQQLHQGRGPELEEADGAGAGAGGEEAQQL